MTDIDKLLAMPLDELESRAMEVPGDMPGDLQARTEELVGRLEIAERLIEEESHGARSGQRAALRLAGIAASVVLLASIGFAWQQRPPKDTFTDPMLAYASLEEAFDLIGRNIRKGSEAVAESGEIIARPVEILNNTIK